ncbi:GvpL/GvpF family gas vesicle protein [Streptomyces sp. M2CJ-2]|nr:GvpL/GvpF family gas vesicle protein [Streptomyces sp. M2CJ-2]
MTRPGVGFRVRACPRCGPGGRATAASLTWWKPCWTAAPVHDAPPTPLQGSDGQVRRWVEEQSRAVNTVWERTGSVLPMTFNVLVAEEPPPEGRPAAGRNAERRPTEWITEQAADIAGRLEQLAGRCELRVGITVDRTAVTTDEAGEDAPEDRPDDLSPGMRRLLAKQREHRARDAAGQLADALHAETRHRLLSVAEDYRDRGPTHRVAGETDVLCAALLVGQEDIDTVGTVLAELRARRPAVRIRFLGPWPPYSFIDAGHHTRAAEMAP